MGSQPLSAYAGRVQASNGLVAASHPPVLRRPSSRTCDGLLFKKAVAARSPFATGAVTYRSACGLIWCQGNRRPFPEDIWRCSQGVVLQSGLIKVCRLDIADGPIGRKLGRSILLQA